MVFPSTQTMTLVPLYGVPFYSNNYDGHVLRNLPKEESFGKARSYEDQKM